MTIFYIRKQVQITSIFQEWGHDPVPRNFRQRVSEHASSVWHRILHYNRSFRRRLTSLFSHIGGNKIYRNAPTMGLP